MTEVFTKRPKQGSESAARVGLRNRRVSTRLLLQQGMFDPPSSNLFAGLSGRCLRPDDGPSCVSDKVL